MFSNIATCQVVNISRWRSWLRHFATTRKVAGSIPDYVTGILPSGRAVALVVPGIFRVGYRRPVTRIGNLITFIRQLY